MQSYIPPPPTFRVLGSSKFFIIYEPHIIILRTSDDANKTIFLLFPIPLDLMSGSIWTLAKCIPSIFANDPPKIGLDYYLLTLKLYWPKKIIKSTCDEKNIHCTNNISKVNKDKLRSVVLIDMIIFLKHKQDTNTL